MRKQKPLKTQGLGMECVMMEEKPLVGFEPTTYALRKHRSAS